MCMGAPSMPKAKEPPPPPAERDANLQGVQKRQALAAAAGKSGLESTLLTGPEGAGGTFAKPTLGA
jgi:hypothetical protein